MKLNYKTRDPKGWMGDPGRGAALGRSDVEQAGLDRDEFSGKMVLQKIPLDSGGYDPNGTYWGLGEPLYWAAHEDPDIEMTFRARNRDDAKRIVRERYPKARFYR